MHSYKCRPAQQESKISAVNKLTINSSVEPVVAFEPSQLVMVAGNNDASDVEEKLDNESEKLTIVQEPNDEPMQIDSLFVHRAFEALQAENARLQKQ